MYILFKYSNDWIRPCVEQALTVEQGSSSAGFDYKIILLCENKTNETA